MLPNVNAGNSSAIELQKIPNFQQLSTMILITSIDVEASGKQNFFSTGKSIRLAL